MPPLHENLSSRKAFEATSGLGGNCSSYHRIRGCLAWQVFLVCEDYYRSCFASQHAAVGVEAGSYLWKGWNCGEVDAERLPARNYLCSSRCYNRRSPCSRKGFVVVTRISVVVVSSDPDFRELWRHSDIADFLHANNRLETNCG